MTVLVENEQEAFEFCSMLHKIMNRIQTSVKKEQVMREIKFRGKPIESKKKWVYGNGFVIDNATVGHPVYVWENTPCCNWFKVDPKTVGEYTGMKDKTGVEIYEGDIIKENDGTLYEIELTDYAFRARHWKNTCESELFFLHELCSEGVKVICSIHDNPELLEVQK
jgi:uncharacterized phage protein (TIGR01671 family)